MTALAGVSESVLQWEVVEFPQSQSFGIEFGAVVPWRIVATVRFPVPRDTMTGI